MVVITIIARANPVGYTIGWAIDVASIIYLVMSYEL